MSEQTIVVCPLRPGKVIVHVARVLEGGIDGGRDVGVVGRPGVAGTKVLVLKALAMGQGAVAPREQNEQR